MKMVQIIAIIGWLLCLTHATNDSRQDSQLEDWLSSFIKNISINFDGALIPTMGITQKDIMDVICNENILDFESELPFLLNNSRRKNTTLENILNATKNPMAFKVVYVYFTETIIEPIIIAIGIVGNLLTMFYIPLKKKLRKPFYYCIVNVALGDTLVLLVNPYCHNLFLYIFNPGQCAITVYSFILQTINRFSKLFSEVGVLILGFVRFLLFVHPIKSRIYLTNCRVFISFFFSFVISAVYAYLTTHFISDTKGAEYIISSCVVDGSSFILLLVVLLVLFYYRYKAAGASVSAQNTKLPMSVVTMIILALNAFKVAASLLYNFRYFYPADQFYMFVVLESYFAIVSAFVHSVNPFIYIVNFNAYRRKWIAFLLCGRTS